MPALKFTVALEGMDRVEKKAGDMSTHAERVLTIQARKDTEKYVPARTKTMARATRVEDNEIRYGVGIPYTRVLWRGMKMVDAVTGKGPMHYTDKKGNEVIRWRKGQVLKPSNRPMKISRSVNPMAQKEWFLASKKANMAKWERVAQKAVNEYGRK